MKTQILIAALTAALSLGGCCGEQATPLFNGRDLTGWVCVTDGSDTSGACDASDTSDASGACGACGACGADTATFRVVDGHIRIAGTPFGYMRTAEPYGDYRLHVEWRWVGEPTNSGIFQRVQPGDGLWPAAVECQLQAGRAGDLLALGGVTIDGAESNGRVGIRKRMSEAGCEKAPGEWNTAEIVCAGDRITVRINGVLQNECTGAPRRGHIALQSEGGPVEFRNIRLTAVNN